MDIWVDGQFGATVNTPATGVRVQVSLEERFPFF